MNICTLLFFKKKKKNPKAQKESATVPPFMTTLTL